MTQPFPKQRFLRGNFAPLRLECDAPDLIIEGEMPRALNGTLLRNGPNPFYPPRDRYHMFSGDGMVHAFHLDDGRASYRNRWVRTEKFERERVAGRALHGTFGNPATSAPEVRGLSYNVANTNIIWHGGRLLALEEFNPPFELDPHTLAARGSYTYGGRISGPLTAHPKIDAETGALHAFGYGLGGFGSTRMAYYHIAAAGELTRTVEFDAPYAAMVHDFIVTAGHLVFPIFPLTISAERARCGRPLLAWEPQLPALLGCLPREGGADDIGWYDGEACCVFHPLNAYQDGTQLIADMLRYDAGPGFPGADGSAPDPAKAAARLERWRIPLAGTTQRYTQERLDDQTSEYPRIDERYAGLPHRYGYFATTPSEAGAGGRVRRAGALRFSQRPQGDLPSAGGRFHFRAGVRSAQCRCSAGTGLAVGGGLSRRRSAQRPAGVGCRAACRRTGRDSQTRNACAVWVPR